MASPAPNHPAYYGPSSTALLLLDYHNMITGMIDDAAAKAKVISTVKALSAAAREANVPIFHCLINLDNAPLPTSRMVERYETQFKPMLAAHPTLKDEDAECAPPANAGPNELTFYRQMGRYSAMKSEGIMEELQKRGIKSLVMCGLSSSGCTLSTSKEAHDDDFVVTVVEDGCWDRVPGLHDTVMKELLETSTWVMGTDEAIKILKHTQ